MIRTFKVIVSFITAREGTLLQKDLNSSPDYVSQILHAFKNKYALTDREVDILRGFMEGKTYEEMSSCLFLTQAGISYHSKSLLKKMGLAHRHQLVVKVMEWFENRQAV
jgi:DNA-binding CsgD family transcriptional regulator